MNRFELISGAILSFVLIAAINVEPGRATPIQAANQVQKPEQSAPTNQPASNYGTRLNERNAAAKQQSGSNKTAKPKQAEAVKNKSGTDTRQLSKRNQAVINQTEAAKKKRALVDKINADRAKK